MVQAATYYIDFNGGNDLNNGTSHTSPWKRAPGMNGFVGSCSHQAGDHFIFKGSVTWQASAFQFLILVVAIFATAIAAQAGLLNAAQIAQKTWGVA